MNCVKQVVYKQVEVVAKGQHKALPPLTDDLPLLGDPGSTRSVLQYS